MPQPLREHPNSLPTGTVTFLFTDMEGSTTLVQRLGPAFTELLETHGEVIRSAVEDGNGVAVSTEGDAFFAVFPAAPDAVAAAAAAQRRLNEQTWPDGVEVRVRMGLHTGLALLGGDNYVGLDVHKAARIGSAAHGGQVLLSSPTAALISPHLLNGVALRDLGEHRLKDLAEPLRLFQLVIAGLVADFPPIRTLSSVPHNLPVQLTSFVGREQKVKEAVQFLSGGRILTLTGPGGTGKTRLSLQVAAEVAESFPDGVFFVPLSPISDPDLVPTAMLESLGLRTTAAGVQPRDHLLAYLAGKELLLLLDNMEQLLDAAPFVAEILRSAPEVKMLVTSRAPLHISGEQEMEVPPLEVPDPDQPSAVEELPDFEAVRLFTERAVAVRPDFELTGHNAPAVAQLTARLDGLPLAIELAASRIKVLTPEVMLERLSNRLLASPSRDLPARQQTLVNAIGWSYDLLEEPCRRLFERFAVFVNGAMLEQIDVVCGPPEEIGTEPLEGLEVLVDHSLLRQTEVHGEPRFRMLMMIREFARGAMVARGEEDELRFRHASAYVELAERAEPHLLTSRQAAWLDRLAADHDNLRAAIEWAVDEGEAETGLRLVGSLWRFWQMRGHLYEARERIEAVLALPGDYPGARAKALEGLGGVLYWLGQPVRRPYEEALAILREHGAPAEVANALYNFSFALGLERDSEGARECLREALTISEELGDRHGVGRALWGLGNQAWYQADNDALIEYSRAAAAEFEKLDAPFDLGWALYMIGEGHRGKQDVEGARRYYEQSLPLFLEANDLSAVVLFLHGFAVLATMDKDRLRAARLAGAARGLKAKTGAGIIDVQFNVNEELDDLLGQADEELAAAFEEGQKMTVEEAAAYALGR